MRVSHGDLRFARHHVLVSEEDGVAALGNARPSRVGKCVRRELVDADQVVERRHVDRDDRLAHALGVPSLEAQRADRSRDPHPVVLGQVSWVESFLGDANASLLANIVPGDSQCNRGQRAAAPPIEPTTALPPEACPARDPAVLG